MNKRLEKTWLMIGVIVARLLGFSGLLMAGRIMIEIVEDGEILLAVPMLAIIILSVMALYLKKEDLEN